MPNSLWRRVRARVHMSLTPLELSNPIRSATRKAFSSILMRYNPDLGGAVVAHIGPVELSGPPVFVDASPLAHVVAIATLLVFAPPKGTHLLGVVTHVGPDHIGLSVLSAFHAVLPIDGLTQIYRYESSNTDSASIRMWKRIDGTEHITTDRQIRFVVSELKPTCTGLFQIIASLDPSLCQQPNQSHCLGLLSPEQEITLSSQSLQQNDVVIERPHTNTLQVSRRMSSGRKNRRLTGHELLSSGNDILGDALAPSVIQTSPVEEKTQRRVSKEPQSVIFENDAQEASLVLSQDNLSPTVMRQMSSSMPPATEKVSKTDSVQGNGTKAVEDSRKSDRKKRKEKKKKKKKKEKRKKLRSGAEKQAKEAEMSASGREQLAEAASRVDAGNVAAAEQTEKAEKEDKKPTNVTLVQKAIEPGTVEHIKKSSEATAGRKLDKNKKDKKQSKMKKKKKRIRRGENGSINTERVEDGSVEKVIQIKTEDRNRDKDEADVNRASSMRMDAERAVELGPMHLENRKDDRLAGTIELKEDEKGKDKKKKKRKRRQSEGEEDRLEMKRKKKKKRMSEAIQIERMRSMGSSI